jgi:eukaryotic translation initiation factor 2C
MGLMTQCVIGKHVHVTKPSYAQNLALKINAKLGGVNSYIDPALELGGLGTSGVPTILMGADVTHPQHGTSDPSSIAAVVGTVDRRFCEYRASIRVQNSRREILADLEGMTREIFELYRTRNGHYPRRILFFRDGVGEGQLSDVAAEEINAVKRACISLGIQDAKVTFTVVNKRHHGRFFPGRNESCESDGKGNILAGTVVDSGVTHPFEFDFYLTSHPGMQGTSKAAHYHVLHDDNKFTADELQEITYRLCYNFARRYVNIC